MKFVKIMVLFLIFSINLFAQITVFTDDFEDSSLDTTWNGATHTLWRADHPATFGLSESNGTLQIDYDRTASSGAWDNFNFTPPEEIDVSANPQITLKIKSDVQFEFQMKPIYSNGKDNFTEMGTVQGNGNWSTYKMELNESNYSGGYLTKIYLYLDGGSTSTTSGVVHFDDLKIAGWSLNVNNLQAELLDSSRVELNWKVNDITKTDHFNVYRGIESGFALNENNKIAETDNTNLQDSGLENYTLYFYKVTAVDSSEKEYSPSNEASIRTYSPGSIPSVEVTEVNSEQVGKYEKFEAKVDLKKAAYQNPYNPDQIDVHAYFKSPAGDTTWINGFYDNYQNKNDWKVRFAADTSGSWEYRIFAVDQDGKGESAVHNFTVTESGHHGWLHVSHNNSHYLVYDDSTSFYGVGAYYPWGIQESGLDKLKQAGGNIFGYWNGNYDGAGNGGGRYQIESARTGIGNYDQPKCARIDQIVNWAEERDLKMMFAIWPHDVLDETVWGYNGWQYNAFKEICESADFYSSEISWQYQEKLYRYIIARWGYSRSMGIWEFVNEINGTDGWVHGSKSEALQWVGKIQNYFKTNDPYNRPTTIAKSGGSHNYWAEGYRKVDMPNVHMYETGWSQSFTDNPVRSSYWTYKKVSRQFWNDFNKPGIMGEAGYTNSYAGAEPGTQEYTEMYHNALWASWSNGLSMTPVWWTLTMLSDDDLSQLQSFAETSLDIDYSKAKYDLTSPEILDCDGFGLHGDSLGFGWIRQKQGLVIPENSINLKNLKTGTYQLQWYNTWSGDKIADRILVSAYNTLVDTLPRVNRPDIAYKLRKVVNGTEAYGLELYFAENALVFDQDTSYNLICVVTDQEGRLVPDFNREITFTLEGSGELSTGQSTISMGMTKIEFTPGDNPSDIKINAQSEDLLDASIIVELKNTIGIDGFEEYEGNSGLRSTWSLVKGASTEGELSLAFDTIYTGAQSMKLNYKLGGASSFIAIMKSIEGNQYSGTNYLSLWIQHSGSGHEINIGIKEGNDKYWQTTVSMDGDNPALLQIPVDELENTYSGKIDFAKVNTFFININPGSGDTENNHSVYIDNVNMLFNKITGLKNDHKINRPEDYYLSDNYPNPFNPQTRIEYSLPEKTEAKLTIYDLGGRKIRVLDQGLKSAGNYSFIWDATNHQGLGVGSGMYLYQLKTESKVLTKKMLLLK